MKTKEAIERVRSRFNKWTLDDEDLTALQTLGLADVESEDEKIRREIISALKFANDDGVYDKHLAWLEKQKEPTDKGEISDGYHTFNELYYYRMLYNAAFFNLLPKEWVHKSKKHHDGEECFGGGWFIVMANLPTGQISNHYELKDWELFQIPEKEVADEWDGHSPQEAAERLRAYLLSLKDEMVTDCKELEKEISRYMQHFSVDQNLCVLNKDGSDITPADIDAVARHFAKWGAEPKFAEWSEKDEHRRTDAIYFLETAKSHYADTSEIEATIDWLKSLSPQPHTVSIKNATKFGNLEYERGVKDGIQHAKNHQWKPSEEQMDALNRSIGYLANYGQNDDDLILNSLSNDLNKL